MSPAAVTRGAATLSMSQPRRADNAATPNVIARTTTDEIAPPATEITAKSTTEMVPATPNATAIGLARATICFGQPATGTRRLRAASGHGGHRRCPRGPAHSSGIDVDVRTEAERRRIGATGGSQDERQRVALDALPAAADIELVEAVERQRRRSPTPLPEHGRHMRQRGLEPGPSDRGEPGGRADVVGVEVRVVPEGLDRVAERAVEAAGRGPGPGRLVEHREQVGRPLGRAFELVGELV